MEKHPSVRPVLVDDIEGIIKAGEEARRLEQVRNYQELLDEIRELGDDEFDEFNQIMEMFLMAERDRRFRPYKRD